MRTKTTVSIPNRDFSTFQLLVSNIVNQIEIVSIPNRDFSTFQLEIAGEILPGDGFNP